MPNVDMDKLLGHLEAQIPSEDRVKNSETALVVKQTIEDIITAVKTGVFDTAPEPKDTSAGPGETVTTGAGDTEKPVPPNPVNPDGAPKE